MNRHIELVEKWLNDNNSVSLGELKANRDAAYTDDAYAASAVAVAANAAYEANAAATAAYEAANAVAAYASAAASYASAAANYVNKYKELTKEDV